MYEMFWIWLITLLVAHLGDASVSVWPLPAQLTCSTDRHVSIDQDDFEIVAANSNSPALQASMLRYRRLLLGVAAPRSGETVVSQLRLELLEASTDPAQLSMSTNYSYSLSYDARHTTNAVATASAASIFGLMYAMETFSQLFEQNGTCSCSSVSISDWPRFRWRGLMVDVGRRFFPLDLLEQVLDAMSFSKLNVLNLHASDYGAVRIESLAFPNLTRHLNGFYSQQEIKALVAYAYERGIRVVPQIDIPGHSSGWAALNVSFCQDPTLPPPQRYQLYDDPAGNTRRVIGKYLEEMLDLFPDEVCERVCARARACGLARVRVRVCARACGCLWVTG
jgi:hexosaminidase